MFLAIWWLGVGLLMRADQPAFARLSLVLAVLAPIGALFTVLDLAVVRYAALGLVFPLWTVWSVWLLILLWQRRPPFALPPE